MTVQDLINTNLFQLINAGDDLDRDITGPFCCDLLSVAMGKAPAAVPGSQLCQISILWPSLH